MDTDPIVVDANVVFAAFIADGSTREIVLDRGLDLRSPAWLWEEVAGRYDWLLQKTNLSAAALDELLRQTRDRIVDIPEASIEQEREEALELAGKAGRKDAPYIAAVLAVDGRLWTHDNTLADEAPVRTVTTGGLLDEADRTK
jgi:predicted nucleic acid-binding protein